MAINDELTEKIEQMSKLIDLILVKVSTASTIISPLLITFVNYFVYGMGDESFRFDGALWFPFDVNKAAGFFSAVIFQCTAVWAVFCSATPVACIYIGSCWTIVTFLKDIANDASHLKRRNISNCNKQTLTEHFHNFVQFHANIQELSEHFFL